MNEPYVKVELVDGTNTWVTIMPIRSPTARDAQRAAGEAFAWFVSSLEHDKGTLERHLTEARGHV